MLKATRKSSVLLLLCLLCAATVSLSLPVMAGDDAVANADKAYKAGDYATAKSLYQHLLQRARGDQRFA